MSLTVLVLATSMVAQAPPSNYEHLKPIEWLIGTWQFEFEAEEDTPGAKPGDKIVFTISNEWSLNKNVIETVWTMKTKDGVTLVAAKVMRGWDPVEQEIVHGGFDSIGGHVLGTTSQDGNDWHFKNRLVRPDGVKESQTLVISNITTNSFSAQQVDRKEDGEDLPDLPAITLKRVK